MTHHNNHYSNFNHKSQELAPQDLQEFSDSGIAPNPEINAKILKLLKLGCPPIPVAPKLDPKHPDGHRVESPEYRYREDKPEFVSCNGERVKVSGDYCKFTTTAVGTEMAPVRGEFVRLDGKLSPTPLFTGKNPSFLGWDGRHRKLNHGQFQNRMPTEQELRKWFANPNTGIGTLGGHNGIVWIDFDAKNYPTQEDCDRDVQALLDRIGRPTLTEKTGSGGYRVAVIPRVKPSFTNFSTEPGGKHLGEALFAGRYTVLAPSKHPNGNYYKEICDADPVEVDSLEAIGLYPSKDEAESKQKAEKKVRKEKGSGDRNTQQTYSDPVDNPWDIRNFAQFFEGYSERDGWGYAKCPAHNGTSLTSFRVRLDTGEFKPWCGCDTKAVYKAGRELAERFGYKPITRDHTFSHTEPDPDAYREYQQRVEEEGRNAEIEAEERQRQWREQYPDRVKNHYKRHRKYTPTHRQNNRFVEFDAPPENSIIGVRSGLGSGKTEKLKKIKEELAGEGAIILADRNSLLHQSRERIRGVHLQLDRAFDAVRDPHSWIFCCPDSLPHFYDDKFLRGRNLIIDETMSVADHILNSKTLNTRRDEVIERFEVAVRSAKRIFLLDGHLTDWAVNYIAKIRGSGANIIKVGNDYRPEKRPPVELLTGSVNEKGLLCKRDYSAFLTDLLKNQATLTELTEGEGGKIRRIAISDDSQVGCEALDNLLAKAGYTVFRFDSKTRVTEEGQAFSEDPNHYLRQHPAINCLIYSPALESGSDISLTQTVNGEELPWFSDLYAIFVGTLTTNRQMQMLGRIRKLERIHIYCPEFTPTRQIYSEFAQTCTRDLLNYLSQDTKVITSDGLAAELEKLKTLVSASKDTPHQEAWGILKATENYERSNLRDCLKDALIEAGYQITEIEGFADKQWKREREVVKLNNSADRFYAEDISLEEAEERASSFSSTWEDRCAVWRAIKTKRQLPGIAQSSIWSEGFCHWLGYEQPDWVKMQETYWLLRHPEVALLMQQQKWAKRVQRKHTHLPDIRSRYLQVKALRQIRTAELLEAGDKEFTSESPEIVSFTSRLTPDVQLALGIKAGKASPIQLLGRVLKLVGFELKGRQHRVNGEHVRSYRVVPIDSDDGPYRDETLEAIERKWGNYVERSKPVDWGVSTSHPTQKEAGVTPGPNGSKTTGAGVTGQPPSTPAPPLHPFYEELKEVVFWLENDETDTAYRLLAMIRGRIGDKGVAGVISQHPDLAVIGRDVTA